MLGGDKRGGVDKDVALSQHLNVSVISIVRKVVVERSVAYVSAGEGVMNGLQDDDELSRTVRSWFGSKNNRRAHHDRQNDDPARCSTHLRKQRQGMRVNVHDCVVKNCK